MAAGNGHLETVKYLLGLVAEYGPESLSEFVNRQNETGNTALHWASLNGHIDVVKCLCDEFGADPFIKNQLNMMLSMRLRTTGGRSRELLS